MRVIYGISATFASALILFVSATSVADDAPLPDDLKVVTPGSDVQENYRRWSGAWRGTWGSELDHILVVEQVTASGDASVVYAWGDSSSWRIERGWIRAKGKISGNELELDRFRNSAEVEYTLEGPNSISGDYWRKSRLTEGTFHRYALPSAD